MDEPREQAPGRDDGAGGSTPPTADTAAVTGGGASGSGASGSGALGRVPIEIVISVGRSRPTIRELLQLQRDSVLPLDRRVSDPVDLLVGERLIARGVLEELDGAGAGLLGVRLTEVIDMRDGL